MANPAAPTPNATETAAQTPAPDQAPAKPKKSPLAFIAGLSAREKMIASVAGLLLVVFALDWIMFKPLSRHLDKLSATIRQKEDLIPKKFAVLSRKDEIEKNYQTLSGYLTDPKLSQEEEIAAYLGEIERVSQGVGLFISNINPVQTEQVGSAYQLKVEVEGAGSISNIKKFVSEIEQSNPAIRVSAFSLRGQGPANEELRFRFSVVKLGLKQQA